MKLNDRSVARLEGVHPDLVKVVYTAATLCPVGFGFVVTEGVRSRTRQAELVARGASKTMNSRHITGHAVDLAVWLDLDGDDVPDGGEIRWDWPLYEKLAGIVKEAAQIEGVAIAWGGDWLKFKDGPHFELSHKVYPA